MEREVLVTGIGGQGVQLASKILAQAAALDDRRVMHFGVYGGMIRGGPSDCTIVASDDEIVAPPIVDEAWALIALHPASLPSLLPKIRAGGVAFVNSTLCVRRLDREDLTIVDLPATRIAEEAGRIVGASMVALGAFVEATGFASEAAVRESMAMSMPAHRRSLLDFNERCLELGRAHVRASGTLPGMRAWDASARAGAAARA